MKSSMQTQFHQIPQILLKELLMCQALASEYILLKRDKVKINGQEASLIMLQMKRYQDALKNK